MGRTRVIRVVLGMTSAAVLVVTGCAALEDQSGPTWSAQRDEFMPRGGMGTTANEAMFVSGVQRAIPNWNSTFDGYNGILATGYGFCSAYVRGAERGEVVEAAVAAGIPWDIANYMAAATVSGPSRLCPIDVPGVSE